MLKKKGKRFAAVLICFSMLGCMGVTSASAEWQWLTDWDDIPYGDTTKINATTPTGEHVKAFYATEGWNYSESRDAFDIQNKEREKAGQEPLVWSDDLYLYACARAKELYEQYSHIRPGETTVQTEDGQYGLGFLGENIGSTISYRDNVNEKTDAQCKIDNWMNSDGHRTNIMDSRYQVGAIACYTNGEKMNAMWVATFSRDENPVLSTRPEIQHADGTVTPLPDDTVLLPQAAVDTK